MKAEAIEAAILEMLSNIPAGRMENYKIHVHGASDEEVTRALRRLVRRKALESKRDADSNGPGQRMPFRWYEIVK